MRGTILDAGLAENTGQAPGKAWHRPGAGQATASGRAGSSSVQSTEVAPAVGAVGLVGSGLLTLGRQC